MADTQPSLYTDLAAWFHILTAPEDYAEEAAFYRKVIIENSLVPPASMLELGSGGGNNASHLKQHFQLTLVDLSPTMLAISRKLNPELEHIQGDMRTLRLERQFDAVFIHDAIVYMTSIDDLTKAIRTAFIHCKPGGVALFAPDHTREDFVQSTSHGGHDTPEHSLRYLEWTWDPDPADNIYLTDFAYLLRDADESVRCQHDRHVCGLFAHATWLDVIAQAGFIPRSLPFEHSEIEPGSSEVFLGIKPL